MSEETDAEDWWAKLPTKRKIQIHKYLARPEALPAATPGQLALIAKEGDTPWPPPTS